MPSYSCHIVASHKNETLVLLEPDTYNLIQLLIIPVLWLLLDTIIDAYWV